MVQFAGNRCAKSGDTVKQGTVNRGMPVVATDKIMVAEQIEQEVGNCSG